MEKELIKLLVDMCHGVKYLKYTSFGRYLTNKKRDEISNEELEELIVNAPREALEEAYYDFIDKEFRYDTDTFKDVVDDLVMPGGIMDFDNIVGEEGKLIGDEGWVRIPTDNGFKVCFAKFVKLPMSTYILKKMKFDNRSSDQLKDILIDYLTCQLITKSNLRPMMAKIQKSKNRYEYVPANQCELIEDDIVERVRQKAEFITTKTIYKKETTDQVAYLRQRGISKQTAETMANLEGTSIHYNMDKAFKSLQASTL